MSTKLRPGEFDCWSAAALDEEMFILLARDDDAPRLVRSWARRYWWRKVFPLVIRFGWMDTWSAQGQLLRKRMRKYNEALYCASSMVGWKGTHPDA